MLRRAVFSFVLLAASVAGALLAALATTPASGQVGTTTPAPEYPATVPGGAVAATLGTSTAPVTLVVAGRGWGHGVGMGQWGTFGFSKRGWTFDRILAHYYRGATLERRPPVKVAVLVVEDGAKTTLASTTPWKVADANGTRLALGAGSVTVGPALRVGKRALVSPLTFSPGAAPLSVDGKPYRGALRLHASRGRIQVVNVVGLEDYLKGVVPSEVPTDWPAEALKAQAVAARSYALSSLPAGRSTDVFDLYADVRDQVYGGVEAEAPPVSRAVEATAGQALYYGGKVVRAYYSSTTGGRTASAEEWLGSKVPYLVSVADPYDTSSPYHTWGPVLFDARKVGRALGLKGALVDLREEIGPSGRVRRLTALGAGSEVEVTGADVRTLLGLRSTWFTIGWLALDPPARAAYGAATRLSGRASGLGGEIVLESRIGRAAWQRVAAVTPGPDGRFELVVRPKATTQYRLAAAGVSGALVSLPVQPIVQANVVSRSVEGSLSPPLPGAPVEVQRQAGGGWATVARSTAGAGGVFAFGRKLAPGSYRVLCGAPGKGLVAGASRTLAVS